MGKKPVQPTKLLFDKKNTMTLSQPEKAGFFVFKINLGLTIISTEGFIFAM
jgi:hypothetical protein